jgi:hypothetical protein
MADKNEKRRETRSIAKDCAGKFYGRVVAESRPGLFLFPETDDFEKIRTATVLFCFLCLFLSICRAVGTGLEFLCTGRVRRFLTLALLRPDKVFADIEKVSHNRPFVLVMVPDLIKEQEPG